MFWESMQFIRTPHTKQWHFWESPIQQNCIFENPLDKKLHFRYPIYTKMAFSRPPIKKWCFDTILYNKMTPIHFFLFWPLIQKWPNLWPLYTKMANFWPPIQKNAEIVTPPLYKNGGQNFVKNCKQLVNNGKKWPPIQKIVRIWPPYKKFYPVYQKLLPIPCYTT